MASYGYYSHHAARTRPDCICRVELPAPTLVLFLFPKKAWIVLCVTDLDPIWMAWSGLGQMHPSWKPSHCARITRPSFWQKATSLLPVSPLSDLVAFFQRQPGSNCAKPARIRLGSGRLCQVLGPTDPVRKRAGERESSGLLLANTSEPIRIGCGSDPACLLVCVLA